MSSLGMSAESLKEEIQTMPITHRFTIIANVWLKMEMIIHLMVSFKLSFFIHYLTNWDQFETVQYEKKFQIKTNTKAAISCTTTFQQRMLHKLGPSPHGLSCLLLLVKKHLKELRIRSPNFSRALFSDVRSKYKTYNDSTIQQRRSCTSCFTWYHNDCNFLWHVCEFNS